ncbi:CBS domain-containing protein [Streptomyces sp. NPDC059991]|uniref:CBS domain-containing protein n=1 Tax=Streptomyces sp. NPDC059991 TaxID=3347028 RepID=UPI0036BCDFEA
MRHDKVGSVMTTDVVRAVCDAPSKEVAQLLAAPWINGLPVADEDDNVIGVLSETDLTARQAAAARPLRAEAPHGARPGRHMPAYRGTGPARRGLRPAGRKLEGGVAP